MPIETRSRRFNFRMARCIKRERRGNLNFLAYPTVGLSHCLVQDKQLELAHAEAYY